MDAAKGTVGLLGLLTTFVLGGASGYAARLGMDGAPRPGEPDSSAQACVAALESVRAELRVALERWNERLAAPSPSVAHTREPLEPREDSLDLVALRELVTRFEQAAQSIPARSFGPLLIPARRAQELPVEPENNAAEEELLRRYQFWTYQQVLDAFGRPDLVEDSTWTYRRVPGSDKKVFGLDFCDGFVVSVWSSQ